MLVALLVTVQFVPLVAATYLASMAVLRRVREERMRTQQRARMPAVLKDAFGERKLLRKLLSKKPHIEQPEKQEKSCDGNKLELFSDLDAPSKKDASKANKRSFKFLPTVHSSALLTHSDTDPQLPVAQERCMASCI